MEITITNENFTVDCTIQHDSIDRADRDDMAQGAPELTFNDFSLVPNTEIILQHNNGDEQSYANSKCIPVYLNEWFETLFAGAGNSRVLDWYDEYYEWFESEEMERIEDARYEKADRDNQERKDARAERRL